MTGSRIPARLGQEGAQVGIGESRDTPVGTTDEWGQGTP